MPDAASPLQASRGDLRGLLALIAAFTTWGLLPLYLLHLAKVPAGQIMAYRLVLCCAVTLGFLAMRGELELVRSALRTAGTRRRLVASAVLISVNWLLYTWAIQNERVIESSLGYFINPLVNVLLGVVVLRERLSRTQWCAVALAASGVGYLTWRAGALPWIAIVLALSFGSYGLVRKTVAVDALAGLAAETLLLTPFGLAYLIACELGREPVLASLSPLALVLLALSGAVTAVPLGLFAFGARRVRYSTVGLVQYIGPSMQLVIGIAVFAEPFTSERAFGFALIWTALALYALDGLLLGRRLAAAAVCGLAALSAAPAHANGAFPDSLGVLLPEDQPERIFVATNFGLVRSDDGGASWGLVCEDAVGTLATLYSLGPPPGNRLMAITLDGLVLSDDGACSFELVPPPLLYPTDAFADPGDGDHVLAVAQVGRSANNISIQGVFASRDGGKTFDPEPLYVADEYVNFTGLEIARADPATVYGALYRYKGVVGSALARSHDGGKSWGRADLSGALDKRLARILAIDPDDADRVYLRAYDSTTQERLAIYDGSTDTIEVVLELEHRMSAFLRRSDGALIVGTREEGAYISTDGGESFTKWRGAPHLRGLGERDGRIYAVADDLTDGFALATSDDLGKSWEPLLRYDDIAGPLECGNVPVICEQPWAMVQARLDAGPLPGELPKVDGDGGVSEPRDAAAGGADAGARGALLDDDCSAGHVGAARPRRASLAAVGWFALVLAVARRRRRATALAHCAAAKLVSQVTKPRAASG